MIISRSSKIAIKNIPKAITGMISITHMTRYQRKSALKIVFFLPATVPEKFAKNIKMNTGSVSRATKFLYSKNISQEIQIVSEVLHTVF